MGAASWSNSASGVAGETSQTSRRKQLRELRLGLQEAKKSLKEVRNEVETGSEILKRQVVSVTSFFAGVLNMRLGGKLKTCRNVELA